MSKTSKRKIENWSPKQKKEWLEQHFLYEFRMLIYSIEKVMESVDSTDSTQRYWCHDSFHLYARSMIQFLVRRVENPTNCVRASDFISNWNQKSDSFFDKEWKEISSRVLHLSASRLPTCLTENSNQKTTKYKFKPLLDKLIPKIKEFLCKVKREYATCIFEAEIRKVEDILKSNDVPESITTSCNSVFRSDWNLGVT